MNVENIVQQFEILVNMRYKFSSILLLGLGIKSKFLKQGNFKTN